MAPQKTLDINGMHSHLPGTSKRKNKHGNTLAPVVGLSVASLPSWAPPGSLRKFEVKRQHILGICK